MLDFSPFAVLLVFGYCIACVWLRYCSYVAMALQRCGYDFVAMLRWLCRYVAMAL